VPDCIIATWKSRSQQIFPGETLAALVVALVHDALLANQDLLYFTDNQASAASLIRVTSSEEDVLFLVQQVHLRFLGMHS
jgi:hypothetical protein